MNYERMRDAIIDGAMIDAMGRGFCHIDDQASEAVGTLAEIIERLMAEDRAENLGGMVEVFRLAALAMKHGDRYTEEFYFRLDPPEDHQP